MLNINKDQNILKILETINELYDLQIQYYKNSSMNRVDLRNYEWENENKESILTEMEILDANVSGLINILLKKYLYNKPVEIEKKEILMKLKQYKITNNPILISWLNKKNQIRYKSYFNYIIIFGLTIDFSIEVLENCVRLEKT